MAHPAIDDQVVDLFMRPFHAAPCQPISRKNQRAAEQAARSWTLISMAIETGTTHNNREGRKDWKYRTSRLGRPSQSTIAHEALPGNAAAAGCDEATLSIMK